MNELSDQNEILVQTVEELEREANDRVALVEGKLQRTTYSLKVRCKFIIGAVNVRAMIFGAIVPYLILSFG